ncbi:MAG: beta strand repeat-containing protein [Candidatus Thorarchaeota archaeon]|jgi:hypothetical protein
MAINFLTGLNIDGNIDLNSNQLKEVRIDNESSAPTGSLGRIYYDTTSNKLRLYNGAWVDIDTGTDGDTTYDLSGVGSTNGTAGVRLAGSDGTNDDVIITGAGTVGVTRSGNTLTVTGTDSAAGTVTSVSGGTGISISGSASVTPTVNIDTVGTDNAILVLTAADPVGADTMWFSDANDNTLKKSLISNFPGFGKDGTVTSVGSGAGLTGGAITGSGSLAVDYAGSDNVVLAAADGTSITLAGTDKVLFSDATDTNAKFANLSQVATYINAGAGSVTSVGVSGGSTGFSFSNSPITSSGTMTMSGTLDVDNGGTGLASYTTGDILYASGASTLAKLGIGTAGQVLKVASGVPSWAADSNSGGTVTSITPAADSGTGTAITTSGTLTLSSVSSLITTTVSGTTWKINTTATNNTGTVTSVTAGAGMTQTGTSTVNPTLNIIPAVGGGISVAADSVSVDATVVRTTGNQTIAGTKTFSSNIVVPVTPSISTNAASKSYVDSTFAGSGALIFQGGYNAATNTPDLDSAPSSAIKQGWTYAVTAAGSFFSETVEDGDLLIAESDSPTALSDWTVVQNNIGIATAGSTDGGTTKGISGFDSANFTVTANGWAQIKAGGISDAELAETYNTIIGIDTDINTSGVDVVDQISLTDGVVQTLTTRTLPTTSQTNLGVVEMADTNEVTAGTITNKAISPATLLASHQEESYSVTFPSTTTNSFSVAAGTHKLGTGPFIIQTYGKGGDQVFMDVTANPSTGEVDLDWTTNASANDYTLVMSRVR